MGFESPVDTRQLLFHFIKIVILIFILLFILVYVGLVKCSSLPGLCFAYNSVMYFIKGNPKILLVYGDDGLGNPALLRQLLSNPQYGGNVPDMMHISEISPGVLSKYSVVIVEKAKTISTDKIIAFINYVDLGGRLIWIGDAGTSLAPDDVVPDSNTLYGIDPNKKPNPWIRVKNNTLYSFDNVLNVVYLGNYCDMFICKNQPVRIGYLEPEPSRSHPLIKGMATRQDFYLASNKNFAIVRTYSGKFTNQVLSIDFGSPLTSKTGQKIDRIIPLAVFSGVGERVLYLAIPPEYLVDKSLIENDLPTFPTPLSNMISSLLE